MTVLKSTTKSEKLLEAWLALSGILRNERLVSGFTFREISICHIIYNAPKDTFITPTDITTFTGMLKSQTNKVLNDLIKKDYISKERNPKDKRQFILTLTETGKKMYEIEHNEVIKLLDTVTSKLTDKRVDSLCKDLYYITDILSKYSKENDNDKNNNWYSIWS